jgi:hypothetical protein
VAAKVYLSNLLHLCQAYVNFTAPYSDFSKVLSDPSFQKEQLKSFL